MYTAGTQSPFNSTFPGCCPAPFLTLQELQKLMYSPAKGCGMRIRGAEAGAVAGVDLVVAGAGVIRECLPQALIEC